MNEVTKTVVFTQDMKEFEEFLENGYAGKHEQAKYMAMSARTNIMMFKATNNKEYLVQATLDVEKGKEILRGFTRPLGCIFTKAA